MTEIPDKVIGRIRKMLALANDTGASEGERENALRMAHATLAKYNLDLATIGSTPEKRGEAEPRVEHRATFYGRPWARLVSTAVAELMFCRYLFSTKAKAKDTLHVFVGSHANAISAAILAEFLVESITREGRRAQRNAGAGNAYFRSFATGAAAVIAFRADRLRKAAAEAPVRGAESDPATPQPPGSAIVLATVYDREAAANAAYVDALGVTDAPRPAFENLDAAARWAGMQYGATVSLDRQVK